MQGVNWRKKFLKNSRINFKLINKDIQRSNLKNFEPRLKFKPHLKYDWFHLKLYKIFQD